MSTVIRYYSVFKKYISVSRFHHFKIGDSLIHSYIFLLYICMKAYRKISFRVPEFTEIFTKFIYGIMLVDWI